MRKILVHRTLNNLDFILIFHCAEPFFITKLKPKCLFFRQ